MPIEMQAFVGLRLKDYLLHRSVTNAPLMDLPEGNRWYDEVPALRESLEQLKSAPHAVKHQSTAFLSQLLEVSPTALIESYKTAS
jgi:hypothetical protein